MTARFILDKIFRYATARAPIHNLRLTWSDGTHTDYFCKDGPPELEIVFKTKRAERHSAFEFYAGLFDAYIDQEVDLLGDDPIVKLADIGRKSIMTKRSESLLNKLLGENPIVRTKQIWQEFRQSNRSKEQAVANAVAHYSYDPAFFEIMLGETVGYSEGYWPDGTETLNEAKRNIYDLVARKLAIRPGDKVVEVGSGWGYMPLLMTDKYGADVDVFNPVPRQNAYMAERFERNGFGDRIDIFEKEHRDIGDHAEAYDRYVSIGVFEHAGLEGYDSWAESIAKALKPGGIGVISTTGLLKKVMTEYLTLKYIFPGGHLPSLPLILKSLDRHGLTLIDIECMWPHYQRTTGHWQKRLIERWDEIEALDPTTFDERFKRIWHMYLAGTTNVFEIALDLYHIVFIKGRDASAYPVTRDFVLDGFEVVPNDQITYYR